MPVEISGGNGYRGGNGYFTTRSFGVCIAGADREDVLYVSFNLIDLGGSAWAV